MSEFKPYHEGMPEYVDLLDIYDDGYLVRLGALADLASRLKVPKDGRDAMRATFANHSKEIDRLDHWPEEEARKAIAACSAVSIAMAAQDEKDAKRQQEQQQ